MAMSSSAENAQDEAPDDEQVLVDVKIKQDSRDDNDEKQENLNKKDQDDKDKLNENDNDNGEEEDEDEDEDDQGEEKEEGKEEEELTDDDGDEMSGADDGHDDDGKKSDNEQEEKSKKSKTDIASPGSVAPSSPNQPPHAGGYHYYYAATQGYNQDSYSDFSSMLDPIPDPRRNRGGVSEPFPDKLHRMLLAVEREGLSEVVGFFSHGRAFAIHKQRRFIHDIMPRFFRQSKLTSFQRQLNLYGFRRLSQGPDNGGYYHELFLKGRPGLCVNMKRVKVKGELKVRRDPDSEPK
jgi:hypothetical protein